MSNGLAVGLIFSIIAFSGGLYLGNKNGETTVNKYLKRFSKSDVACMAISYEGEEGVRKVDKLKVFDGLNSDLHPLKDGVYNPNKLIATCAISGSKKKESITQLPDKDISQSLTLWADSPWTAEKQPATAAILNPPPSTNKQ